MMITNPTSYFKAQAQGLHTRWVLTLKEMKQASAPVQYIFRSELTEIYTDAKKLYDNSYDNLDALSRSQLEHILSRPIDQHFAIITSR
jgi:hypothetical protein